MVIQHGKAGRPRSKEAWQSVMTATLALLQTLGYRKLTMEGIAKAAGIGKPTLYRWWPNVPSIVMEVLTLHAEKTIKIPDTGFVKKDVLQYLVHTCKSLSKDKGEIMCSLMAEAQFNSDFAGVFRDEFITSRRNTLISILRRGIDRGELPQDTDLELYADLFYGPIWYRLMNRHGELDIAFVRSLVDAIIPAVVFDAD